MMNFYDTCVKGLIIRKIAVPGEMQKLCILKIAIMEQLLDLRHSKCYKIGSKDFITRNNDFEMATGNLTGVIGYDSKE